MWNRTGLHVLALALLAGCEPDPDPPGSNFRLAAPGERWVVLEDVSMYREPKFGRSVSFYVLEPGSVLHILGPEERSARSVFTDVMVSHVSIAVFARPQGGDVRASLD